MCNHYWPKEQQLVQRIIEDTSVYNCYKSIAILQFSTRGLNTREVLYSFSSSVYGIIGRRGLLKQTSAHTKQQVGVITDLSHLNLWLGPHLQAFTHGYFDDYGTNLPTVYPKKYAHGFVVLCFVVVMQSFIMNSHEVFIHIHQGCFAGTGAIVRLPQCQWSKPDGYGKISQCITTTKQSKAKTVCIFLGIYCML